jgi:hypothetical protein
MGCIQHNICRTLHDRVAHKIYTPRGQKVTGQCFSTEETMQGEDLCSAAPAVIHKTFRQISGGVALRAHCALLSRHAV